MRTITLAMTAWLMLGLPLWYFTLHVKRAQLDYGVLEEYDMLSQSRLSAGVRIGVFSDFVPDLAAATQFHLKALLSERKTPVGGVYPHFIVDGACTPAAELCVRADLGEHDAVSLDPNTDSLSVEFRSETLASGKVPEVVAALLLEHIYFGYGGTPHHAGYVDGTHSALTAQYAPKLHLTFSLLSEEGQLVEWAAAQALERHLGALLRQISDEVVELSVDTQTALYARPHNSYESMRRQLHAQELTSFVDFAEWPLSSQTRAPSLQFVLYVPETPIEVVGSPTNSFIIPQWGGVVVSPPLAPENALLSAHELEPVMGVFARQLLALLGMRERTDVPKESRPPLEVRLADLARQNSARGLRAAAASIGSLQRLAASMPAIPIPQGVSDRVEEAISAINSGLAALDAADLRAAAVAAQTAYTAAEQAFFNKDMVAQAYFPDEHKLAVYMPLIGPIVVVVFSGWMRLWKQRKDAVIGDVK